MEDHDGFEAPTEEKKAKGDFVLGLFETGKTLSPIANEVHVTLKELAHKLAKELPEGNARTMLLERLLDTKDLAVRLLEAGPKS